MRDDKEGGILLLYLRSMLFESCTYKMSTQFIFVILLHAYNIQSTPKTTPLPPSPFAPNKHLRWIPKRKTF